MTINTHLLVTDAPQSLKYRTKSLKSHRNSEKQWNNWNSEWNSVFTFGVERFARWDELESLWAEDPAAASSVKKKKKYIHISYAKIDKYLQKEDKIKRRSEQDLPRRFILCVEGTCLSQYNLKTHVWFFLQCDQIQILKADKNRNIYL